MLLLVWSYDTEEARDDCVHAFCLKMLHDHLKPYAAHSATCQEYQWLEFFAGLGNLTRVMKSADYKGARFDLLDNVQPPNRKSNFMNLLHGSGFAQLVLCTVHVVSARAMLHGSLFLRGWRYLACFGPCGGTSCATSASNAAASAI